MLNVALVGFGYWGPNIARNINTVSMPVSIKFIPDKIKSLMIIIEKILLKL